MTLGGKFGLSGGELHDSDVVGGMKLDYIPMEPRVRGKASGETFEFFGAGAAELSTITEMLHEVDSLTGEYAASEVTTS